MTGRTLNIMRFQKEGCPIVEMDNGTNHPDLLVGPKSHHIAPFFSLILILILIFGLCLFQVSAADHQSLSCGVILPLSGEYSQQGTSILQGIVLAADEVNAEGGVNGHLIDLRICDDTGDPDTALHYFQEMQKENIPVVIGSFTTDLTVPMARESVTHEIILISPTANGEELYGISSRFYQIYGSVTYAARSISDWLSYTADRVACIYIDDEYGRSFYQDIKAGLDDAITISAAIPVSKEETDFFTFRDTVLDSAPDSIVIILYDHRLIPILQNLTDSGYRGKIVLADSFVIDDLEKNASDIISKFFLFTISANSNLVPGVQTQKFIRDYQEKFGVDPTGTLAGYGYDSLMVTADAIRLGSENETISLSSIQKGFQKTRYFGVTGPKVFDAHNSVSPALDRYVYMDGKFRLLTTSLP